MLLHCPKMVSQYRPSLSRTPISSLHIPTTNLGQRIVRSPSPQSESHLVTLSSMTPLTRAGSMSSDFLTPPSVDSSPRARHPLADSQEYFTSPTILTKPEVVLKPLSPRNITPRTVSPLAGSKTIINHNKTLHSPPESMFSLLSQYPRDSGETPTTTQPRRSSFSKLEKPKSMKTLAERRASRARERQKWLNPHFHAAQEPWNRTTWRIPRCQMAPTAPDGFKDLCTKRISLEIPGLNLVLSNQDIGGSLIRGVGVQGSIGITSRRWSSVELGTHQALEAFSKVPSEIEPRNIYNPRTRRRHARTMTKNAIPGEELANIVCSRLMSRKLAAPIPRIPATTALEHASSESKSTTTTSLPQHPVEYVVTGKEIDSIAEIIILSLQQESSVQKDPSSQLSFASSFASKNSRVMSFTHQGLVPVAGMPVKTTVTPTEAYRFSEKLLEAANGFHFPPKSRKSSRTRNILRQSKHEVIWIAGSSENQAESPFKLQLTERGTSQPKVEHNLKAPVVPDQPSPAFDPKNAIASINQWSWDLPTKQSSEHSSWNDMASPAGSPEDQSRPCITRSQSNKNEGRPVKDPRRLQGLRTHLSDSNMGTGTVLENVVSFPPLPRKLTCDWILPLPDMECTPPSTGTRVSSTSMNPNISARTTSTTRCLYDQGIDATMRTGSLGTKSPLSTSSPLTDSRPGSRNTCSLYDKGIDAAVTEPHRLTKIKSSPIRIVPHPPKGRPASPKVKFDPKYEMRRNKSVVQAHVKVVARTGDRSTVGSSIGSSSRRKKSTHVAIRDDSLNPSSSSTTWSKIRADSGYPQPMSPSSGASTPVECDGEDDDEDEKDIGIVSPTPNREELLRNQYPGLPTRDHIGIYDAMTGARRVKAQEQGCIESGCEQPIHHAGVHSRNPSVDWIG